MATKNWKYEKLDENGKLKTAPVHDLDGKITGKHIINLKCWFDENPAERIRLGWVKHYYLTGKEVRERFEYNWQTQFVLATAKMIDEYTCEDEYHIENKSEEQLLFDEMMNLSEWGGGAIIDADDLEEL